MSILENHADLSEQIATRIQNYFSHIGIHVIDIAMGPVREEWFNAEVFVPLARTFASYVQPSGDEIDLYFWGEDSLKSYLAEACPKVVTSNNEQPDVIAYCPQLDAECRVAFVVEQKVAASSQADESIDHSISRLVEQMRSRKMILKNSCIVGVIYSITKPGTDGAFIRPSQQAAFHEKVKNLVEKHRGTDIEWATGFGNGSRGAPIASGITGFAPGFSGTISVDMLAIRTKQ